MLTQIPVWHRAPFLSKSLETCSYSKVISSIIRRNIVVPLRLLNDSGSLVAIWVRKPLIGYFLTQNLILLYPRAFGKSPQEQKQTFSQCVNLIHSYFNKQNTNTNQKIYFPLIWTKPYSGCLILSASEIKLENKIIRISQHKNNKTNDQKMMFV